MPGRRRRGPHWPGPRWRRLRSGCVRRRCPRRRAVSISSGAGSTPVSSPSRVTRRRLVSGITPGMMGMVTPARRARDIRSAYCSVWKNTCVMAKSAPERCFASSTSTSCATLGDSGCRRGVGRHTDRDLAGAQQRRASLFNTADEFDQVLGVPQRPVDRRCRRPWAGRRAAPGCRARRCPAGRR